MGTPSESGKGTPNPIRQQEAVGELGQYALETNDVEQLLQHACAVVADTLNADCCLVLELRYDEKCLLLREDVGLAEGLDEDATIPISRDSPTGSVLDSGEPAIVDNLYWDDLFADVDLNTNHERISGISALIGTVDEPWGLFETYGPEQREFTEADATFVQNVANILASAIETKQANQELADERTLKDRIVETSPIGITVIDADGELEFANRRAEEILGRPREEIETFSHDDPRWGLTTPEDEPLADGETPFEQVMATSEPVYDIEVGLERPDGERIWLSLNVAPLPPDESDATATGAVFTFTDITDQKRIESEFEEMLTRITDAFYAVDDEFRFTHVNERAAELLQRPEEELLGEQLWELYPEAADIDGVWDAFHTALNEQTSTSYELFYPPLDFWVEANLYPSETGVSVYFRDITETKQREEQLEQANERLRRSNERLEQFAYAASHDLQEPLRMVSTYLQLIEQRYEDDLDESGQEFLEFAVDGADRMRAMIEGLLEYSRVDTQGDPLEPIELDTVLEDVLTDLQVKIEETGAAITAESLPRVEGDASQLRQLFQNLLENALRYSGDEPPRVEISAERDEGEVVVSIHDEGIGIDPEQAGTIFEVFERLHTNEGHAGTGIGLALCERIVERHCGEIWVDSEPGEGSTFSFTLMAADDPDE